MNIKKFLILSALGLGTAGLYAGDCLSDIVKWHIRARSDEIWEKEYPGPMSCLPGHNPRIKQQEKYIEYFTKRCTEKGRSIGTKEEFEEIFGDEMPGGRKILHPPTALVVHPWQRMEDTKSAEVVVAPVIAGEFAGWSEGDFIDALTRASSANDMERVRRIRNAYIAKSTKL